MNKSTIVTLTIIGLAIVYVFIFWGYRPIGGEITQDRPIIRWLCEQQIDCRASIGPYKCTGNSEGGSFKRLSKWKGFHGCNNQTEGYEEGYVTIEACSCGGIM